MAVKETDMVLGACNLAGEMASHNSRVLAAVSTLEQAPLQGGLPSWGWLSGEAALGPSYPSAPVKPRPWFSGETKKGSVFLGPVEQRGE